MSNQEYYQSFQQESNLYSTGATSTGLNTNSYSEPPPYRNDFEEKSPHETSGLYAPSGNWEKNELIPGNQEQPYRSSNNQTFVTASSIEFWINF